MSAVSAKYQMWGAELMRKGEKENLRIQLGERFYDYVEKCRKFLGWKQMKICEAIANSMNGEEIGTEKKLKANTIYQYKQKGVSGKQAENLLNACIEFHITYHVPRIELSQFVTEYKEIARKLLKREVNIDTSGLPYVVEYSHELSEEEKAEWDRVVCPDKLRKKLDDFFKKESKCMIIQGTRKSGIVVDDVCELDSLYIFDTLFYCASRNDDLDKVSATYVSTDFVPDLAFVKNKIRTFDKRFEMLKEQNKYLIKGMELTGERQYIHNVSQIRKENYLEEDDDL